MPVPLVVREPPVPTTKAAALVLAVTPLNGTALALEAVVAVAAVVAVVAVAALPLILTATVLGSESVTAPLLALAVI